MQSQKVCPDCRGTGITFKEVCDECRGTGIVNKVKTISVNIPEGVDSDFQLRIPKKGNAGENGAPNGDLYVEFNMKPHPVFERQGDDVYLELPINIAEAALGCKKDIRTLSSIITLSIPSGTESGDKQRIKGKGIKNATTGNTGDMYLIFEIVLPDKLSREQKNLFEKLSDTNLENNVYNKFTKFVNKK